MSQIVVIDQEHLAQRLSPYFIRLRQHYDEKHSDNGGQHLVGNCHVTSTTEFTRLSTVARVFEELVHVIVYRVTHKKYSCLIKHKIHNKTRLFKVKFFLDYQPGNLNLKY